MKRDEVISFFEHLNGEYEKEEEPLESGSPRMAIRQAQRSPASLLAHRACGCYEIHHLGQPVSIYAYYSNFMPDRKGVFLQEFYSVFLL